MMDDVLVHGRNTEEHNEQLDKVLQKLQEAELTVNRQKCHFSKSQKKFLGQIVDRNDKMISEAVDEDLFLQQENGACVSTVMQTLPATEKQLERVRQHQKEDEEC